MKKIVFIVQKTLFGSKKSICVFEKHSKLVLGVVIDG